MSKPDPIQNQVKTLSSLFINSFICLFLFVFQPPAGSAEVPALSLPPPARDGGKPLQTTLNLRKTTREFTGATLSAQILSDLLWAAFGVNRPENGRRTAPSAMNSQEIELYVALPNALYRYDAEGSRLQGAAEGDFRGRISGSAFATNAAVVLIYVADLSRLDKAKADTRLFYAAVDTGCIVQNVYLFCASAGLGTVVFDLDRPPLTKSLKLKPEQSVIMAQAVGVPSSESPARK
jgi:nitroreductase